MERKGGRSHLEISVLNVRGGGLEGGELRLECLHNDVLLQNEVLCLLSRLLPLRLSLLIAKNSHGHLFQRVVEIGKMCLERAGCACESDARELLVQVRELLP